MKVLHLKENNDDRWNALISLLEAAKKELIYLFVISEDKEKYKLTFEALTTLKEAKEQLDTMIHFNEHNIQNWIGHKNNIKTHQEQKTDFDLKLQVKKIF